MDLSPENFRNLTIPIVEILIFYFACNNIFSKTTKYNVLKYILSTMLSAIIICISLSNLRPAIKYTLVIFLVSIIMNMLYYNRNKTKVFSVLSVFLVIITVYGFMFVSDYIVLSFIKIFDNVEIYHVIEGGKDSIFVLIITSKIIVLILVHLITKHKKNKLKLTYKQTLILILLSILTVIGILSSIIPKEYTTFPPKLTIPLIFMLINLLIYYVLDDFMQLSEELRIKSINEIKSIGEIKLWKEMNDKDLVQRKMLHDYSETLLCIRTYLENNKVDELTKFVFQLSSDYKPSTSVIRTGNILFDVLINTKYETAIKDNINMVLKLDNLEHINLDDEDFIFLMSNLIDNAIDHTLTLKKEKREIFLNIRNIIKYKKLEILIRNPIETNILVENDLIDTSKKGYNHGLGLLNIKDIIEKYNGEGNIYVDDGFFTYIITV